MHTEDLPDPTTAPAFKVGDPVRIPEGGHHPFGDHATDIARNVGGVIVAVHTEQHPDVPDLFDAEFGAYVAHPFLAEELEAQR